MHLRRLLGLALIASALTAGSALAAGEVGGPPTSNFDRCDKFVRPCTDPVILATGRNFLGRVEVVGFGSAIGLCLGVDTLERNGTSGSFGCGGEGAPPKGRAISLSSVIGSGSSDGHFGTQIFGTVRSDVAAVRIRYRRSGAPKLSDPVFNQVDDELAERIGEAQQFGVFETTVRGCIEPARFRATAFSTNGEVLGKGRFPRFGDFCDFPMPPFPEGSRTLGGIASSASEIGTARSYGRRFEHWRHG